MELKDIVYLVILGVIALAGVISVIVALIRGEVKKFVIEKMEEAEKKFADLPKPEKSKAKLKYVLEQVNEHYGLSKKFLNIKKFIEKTIELINGFKAK